MKHTVGFNNFPLRILRRKKLEIFITFCCVSYIFLVLYREVSYGSDNSSRQIRQDKAPSSFFPQEPRDPIPTNVQHGASYTPQFPGGLDGKQFNVSRALLKNLQFPIRDFVTLNYENVRSFVFATACDADYYTKALDLISSIQINFPDRDIFLYDLGLFPNQTEELDRLCNVIVRDFWLVFPNLPVHVSNLRNYAWKALVIHDALQNAPGVFWVDTSVKFHDYNLTAIYDKLITKTQGVGLFTGTGHSIYAATFPQMFHYLPTSLQQAENVEMLEAGAMVFYKTRPVYSQVLQWLVLCSLDQNCIDPRGARLFCRFNYEDRFHRFARCHRFDQSAVNILLANAFYFQMHDYLLDNPILNVSRDDVANEITLSSCN